MSGFTTIPLQVSGALGSASMSGDVLQLDNVIFDELALEVPEQIRSVGGVQRVEQRDFPGGIRTHQTFGAFPDEVTWSGIFTGTNAFARMQQVDLIRTAGREVLLRYGPKAWLGRVASFTPAPKHRWLIPYTIHYLPRVDISQSVPAQPTPTPEAQIAAQIVALTLLSGGVPFPVPLAMRSPAAALLSTTSLALAAAGGVVDNIGLAAAIAIAAAAAAVSLAARPLLLNIYPLDSYMALAMAARAAMIAEITQHPVVGAVTEVQMINPNLPLLAAQYLHDAKRWRDIAYFNGLNDPQPIGSFVIKIPSADSSPIPNP